MLKKMNLEQKIYTCLNHGAIHSIPVTKGVKSYFRCGLLEKNDPINVKKYCPAYSLIRNKCQYVAAEK